MRFISALIIALSRSRSCTDRTRRHALSFQVSLCLNAHRPLLLSAHVKDDNQPFDADLANPDLPFDGHQKLARGLVHLVRSRFLWNGAWHECIAALMASFAGRGAES